MLHIIIKHMSGSKADEVEKFPADLSTVLTIGRGTDQVIRYDPDKDDLVSHKHAKISQGDGYNERFLITDLNSRNGTYVNRQRISGPANILPGDVIQLGPGGPGFEFDLDPRPNGMSRRTREVITMPGPGTREATHSGSSPFSSSTKAPVGRATVERMLGLSQQNARKTLMNTIAALVGVIVIVAVVLVYLNMSNKQEAATRLANMEAQLKAARDMVTASQNISATNQTMSPTAITTQFGPATVLIEVSGKIIDPQSDRPVYQRYEDGKYPSYIRIRDRIFPWLTTDDENNTNKPIFSEAKGSGFVVANNGFILTSRHVAAPWHTQYDGFRNIASKLFIAEIQGKNLVIQYNPKKTPLIEEPRLLQKLLQEARQWVPADEQSPLVERHNGEYYVRPRQFETRDRLDITFPKNRLRMPAKLVRRSDDHDVALIRVEVPGSVPEVQTHDSYSESRPGDVVTVLGYPSVSPDVEVRIKSYDPLNPSPKTQVVPTLTVTNGLIGKIIRGEAIPKGGNAGDYNSPGDLIQLTVNATGAGNSGGPVFDDRGRVIGIFTYSIPGDVRISAAVPIRFGLEIMGAKPVLE